MMMLLKIPRMAWLVWLLHFPLLLFLLSFLLQYIALGFLEYYHSHIYCLFLCINPIHWPTSSGLGKPVHPCHFELKRMHSHSENCKSATACCELSDSTCWLSKISVIWSSSTVGSESLKKVFRSLHLYTVSSPGLTPSWEFSFKALHLRSPTKSLTSTLKAIEIEFFVESMNRQKILVEDMTEINQLIQDRCDMADFEKSSVRWLQSKQ